MTIFEPIAAAIMFCTGVVVVAWITVAVVFPPIIKRDPFDDSEDFGDQPWRK